MRRALTLIVVAAGLIVPSAAQAQDSEVVSLARELVRVNTSNPPGNERQVAELLAPRLRALGFEVDIIQTPTPNKAHLVARLRAANPTERPILLAGHIDTVGVEPELWTFEPFGGATGGGYLFGRGSLDFKGGLAAWAPLGEGNASVEGAEPTRYRPDWGGLGRSAAAGSVTFVSGRGLDARDRTAGVRRRVAVAGTRELARADLIHNRAAPPIEVDVTDGTVRLDGRILAVDPVSEVPLSRRYLLR